MNRTPRQVAVLAGAIIAGLIVVLWLWGPDEQSYIDTRDAVAAAAPAVTAGATVVASPAPSGPPTTSPAVAPAPVALAEHATVDAKVQRGEPIPGQALPVDGLNGLPFAPDGLERCDEMAFYRRQAGLPDRFDGVGFRESSCRNTVSSWCCHGYWQIHDEYWVPMAECHVATVDDLLGDDPIDKQRNACAAAVVYRKQGGGAWDAW